MFGEGAFPADEVGVRDGEGEIWCIQIPEGASLQDARVQAMIKRNFGCALA